MNASRVHDVNMIVLFQCTHIEKRVKLLPLIFLNALSLMGGFFNKNTLSQYQMGFSLYIPFLKVMHIGFIFKIKRNISLLILFFH